MKYVLLIALTCTLPTTSLAGAFEDAMAIVKNPAELAKKTAAAEKLFKQVVADQPANVDAWYNLGLLALRADRRSEAKKYWQQALKQKRDYLPARARIATLALADPGAKPKAVLVLNEIIEKERFQPEARNALAELAIEAKDWEQALKHSRNVLLGDPSNVNAYLNMAVTYYRQKRYDQAFLILKQAMERSPRAASLHNLKGLIYLAKDNSRLASGSFLQAIKYDPEHLDAIINLASLELSYGDFSSAEKRFKQVLKRRPDDPHIVLSYAVVMRGLERFDDARKGYERALELQPEATHVHYNLCVLFYQFTNQYAEAEKSCGTYLASIKASHPKYREMRRRVRTIKELIEAEAQEKANAAKAACTPTCDGRSCGDDGCGGQCGTCPEGQACSAEGLCAKSKDP